jgi:hypothetical protein
LHNPINQEEESLNNNDNDTPLSTTTEVAIVRSNEMLRNPIVMKWILAPMIVGCYAIASTLSITREVVVVRSTEMLRNPIVMKLQWLLAPMIVGFWASGGNLMTSYETTPLKNQRLGCSELKPQWLPPALSISSQLLSKTHQTNTALSVMADTTLVDTSVLGPPFSIDPKNHALFMKHNIVEVHHDESSISLMLMSEIIDVASTKQHSNIIPLKSTMSSLYGSCWYIIMSSRLDQIWITLASRGEKILDHGVSQQGVVLQFPVSEADASAFKEEEVRQCVSCLISHKCLIPRHIFSFDFFLSLFEIV